MTHKHLITRVSVKRTFSLLDRGGGGGKGIESRSRGGVNVEGAHTDRLSSFDVDEPLDADSGSEGRARRSATNFAYKSADISAHPVLHTCLSLTWR